MVWGAAGRREQLAEELEQVSRGLAASAVLMVSAALALAILPAAVLLSGASMDWLSPTLTGLAAILAGTKAVAAAWGIVGGASSGLGGY